MALGFLSVLGILTKVVGKFLPGKPKEIIDATVSEIVTSDKEIQERIEQERNFILEYEGRAEVLPKWALGIRALMRPFVLFLFSTFMVIYYALTGKMPDPWFVKIAGATIMVIIIGRTGEKILNRTQ